MLPLKTIVYRGGIARFQIPASWVEEYEPRGGGTFYEPGDDTGTLRINVLGFEWPAESENVDRTAFEILALTRNIDEIELLPRGTPVARSVNQENENDVLLRIYNWQICLCVPPMSYRMVVFTYTIIEGQHLDPKMQEELQLLDRLIVAGEYPPVEGVSGDYFH